MEKEVLKVYKSATKEISGCVKDIWLQMLSDGEISISNLNNYDRYKKIQETINKELYRMGVTSTEIINAHLESAYIDTFGEAIAKLGGTLDANFAQFNKETISSIVNANFKGGSWSDRIWNNQDKLREQLQNKVIESVVIGRDVRKVSKELARRMEVSLSDSKRIIRTETMRVLNDGCINAAKDRGYTHVEWLAENDERLCDVCSGMDGKIFPINEAPSINHPNCRCTILPVVK